MADRLGNAILSDRLAAWLLGDFLDSIAGQVVREFRAIGLNDRPFVLIALGLVLLVWLSFSKWIQRVSDYFTPQARDWNQAIHISLISVKFVLLFAIKTYAQDLLGGNGLYDQTFTTAARIMIFVLGFITVVGLYIFVQKYSDASIDANRGPLPF